MVNGTLLADGTDLPLTMVLENLEMQLIAMANDPEIQNELQIIETEFAIAEADGLEAI